MRAQSVGVAGSSGGESTDISAGDGVQTGSGAHGKARSSHWIWRAAVPATVGLVAGFFVAVLSGATHAGGELASVLGVLGAAVLVAGISTYSSWAVGRWSELTKRRRRAKVAALHVDRLRTLLLGLDTLMRNPGFASDPLLPGSPSFEAVRCSMRRIGDAVELDPDFEDLVDSLQDLDVLEKARWAFQSGRQHFQVPDRVARDVEAMTLWMDTSLRTDETQTALTSMIHHLDTVERHLTARAAG